ncbi:MAG: DinB family protein [Bacteroidota bacterium]|nr:DinB family protein [Bacteroidota bacterium]
MAKFKTEELIKDLEKDVRRIKEAADFFSSADKNKLVYSPDKGKWSVVQVLEHLNAYNRHYLPIMEKHLSVITHDTNAWFNSGFWGDKFVKMMKPKNVFEVKNKMKTSKKMSFPNSLNIDTVLKEFLEGQDKLLQLLGMAKGKELGKIHVPITVTSLIKFRLGDTFRFLIAHEQRHMIQARNTLKTTGVSTEKFPVILEAVAQKP